MNFHFAYETCTRPASMYTYMVLDTPTHLCTLCTPLHVLVIIVGVSGDDVATPPPMKLHPQEPYLTACYNPSLPCATIPDSVATTAFATQCLKTRPAIPPNEQQMTQHIPPQVAVPSLTLYIVLGHHLLSIFPPAMSNKHTHSNILLQGNALLCIL